MGRTVRRLQVAQESYRHEVFRRDAELLLCFADGCIFRGLPRLDMPTRSTNRAVLQASAAEKPTILHNKNADTTVSVGGISTRGHGFREAHRLSRQEYDMVIFLFLSTPIINPSSIWCISPHDGVVAEAICHYLWRYSQILRACKSVKFLLVDGFCFWREAKRHIIAMSVVNSRFFLRRCVESVRSSLPDIRLITIHRVTDYIARRHIEPISNASIQLSKLALIGNPLKFIIIEYLRFVVQIMECNEPLPTTRKVQRRVNIQRPRLSLIPGQIFRRKVHDPFLTI